MSATWDGRDFVPSGRPAGRVRTGGMRRADAPTVPSGHRPAPDSSAGPGSPPAPFDEAALLTSVAQAQERARRAADLRTKVDALRVRGRSSGGEVGVEVDAVGRLLDLDLTAAALRRRPDVLARLVLRTVADAEQAAREQVRGLAREALGPVADGMLEAWTAPAARPAPGPS